MTKVLWIAAAALLVVTYGVIIFGLDSGGDEEAAAGGETDAIAAHVDEEDDPVAIEEHSDDAAEHVEMSDEHADDAGEHADGVEQHADGGTDANAGLEAAPKDALALVQMTNLSYDPDVIEVGVGEVLEIAIQNVEPVPHDFTIDRVDADVHVSYLTGTGEHEHVDPEKVADVHFALTEPGSGVVHLKINEPGEYVFYCSVPGHREAGMEGKLVVS